MIFGRSGHSTARLLVWLGAATGGLLALGAPVQAQFAAADHMNGMDHGCTYPSHWTMMQGRLIVTQ